MANALKRHSTAIATIALLAAGAAGIVYSYQASMAGQRKREEIRKSGEVPQAVLDVTEFDWGPVDRDTIAEQSFTLRNSGNTPLEITLIVTSCGCTTAELLLGGEPVVLPAVIPPNGEGTIHVKFDPSSMDVRGNAKRAVRIETNDPDRPFLVINLQAYVR